MNRAFFLLVIIAVACNQNLVFEKEISTVDSLTTELNDLNLSLDSMDLVAAKKIASESRDLHHYLVANYPDSTNRNFWVNKMDPLYEVQRGLSKFFSQEPALRKEMDYTYKQLETLRNSLIDEKLEAPEVEKYLQQEKAAVEEIAFTLNKIQYRAKGSLQKWEVFKDELNAVADSLKAL